jgi:hypothetical protein
MLQDHGRLGAPAKPVQEPTARQTSTSRASESMGPTIPATRGAPSDVIGTFMEEHNK